MKALTFWEAAAFQYTNPKTGMLAAATAGSFIGNSATIARISTIVAIFSIATVRQSYHLGLAGCGAAKLAWRGRANANLQHRDGRSFSPPLHCG